MFKKKQSAGITLIAENAELIGDVQFSGELFVYGRILGNVVGRDDASRLTVAQNGVIVGEVRVGQIVIDGRIEGDVFAHQKVELAGKAVVLGNLYYSLIEMQLGCRVDGQLVHTDEPGVADNNVLSLPDRKAGDS